jgi:HK97 family phage prohead protease
MLTLSKRERTSMRFYWPIAKVDAERRMVWGYASTEAADEQGETVTRGALAAALDDYMRFANIREMHQASAVGVAKEAELDDKGLYLGAKIVDADAWAKIVEGVYKGFSIGGRVTARDPADRSVITALCLTEISVVDRPAKPERDVRLLEAVRRARPARGRDGAAVRAGGKIVRIARYAPRQGSVRRRCRKAFG